MNAADPAAGSYDTVDSPLGRLLIVLAGDGALLRIEFDADPPAAARPMRRGDAVRRQLEEYFAGRRRRFELELRPCGSRFQHRVWQALLEVPYGRTMSYGRLAEHLGGSPRAVGRANATNPIPIVIPCHRVIGADGALTGYGGGLERKRRLLELEGVLPGRLL